MEVVVVCVLQRLRSSGVASMEQMEQLLPGPLRTTSVIRANPLRYSGGDGGGGGAVCLVKPAAITHNDPTVRCCASHL